VGRRTAERLAYHLIRVPEPVALSLADAIRVVRRSIVRCSECFHVGESDPCAICGDERRDHRCVCVVEEPKDLIALEASGAYRGLYHVLGGRVAPLEGTGVDDLTVRALVRRTRDRGFEEVLLATNPDLEGEGTALAVIDALRPTGVRITRLARGLPAGSRIEYMNRAVLSDAIDGRRDVAALRDDP